MELRESALINVGFVYAKKPFIFNPYISTKKCITV